MNVLGISGSLRRRSYNSALLRAALSELPDDVSYGEWHDLAGSAATRTVEEQLLGEILERFDPDAIAVAGAASVRRREIVRDAMMRNGTSWDHMPFFDAAKQYVR